MENKDAKDTIYIQHDIMTLDDLIGYLKELQQRRYTGEITFEINFSMGGLRAIYEKRKLK